MVPSPLDVPTRQVGELHLGKVPKKEISPTFFLAPECHSSISLDMKSLSVTAGVINRSAFSPFWLARPLTSPLEIL